MWSYVLAVMILGASATGDNHCTEEFLTVPPDQYHKIWCVCTRARACAQSYVQLYVCQLTDAARARAQSYIRVSADRRAIHINVNTRAHPCPNTRTCIYLPQAPGHIHRQRDPGDIPGRGQQPRHAARPHSHRPLRPRRSPQYRALGGFVPHVFRPNAFRHAILSTSETKTKMQEAELRRIKKRSTQLHEMKTKALISCRQLSSKRLTTE